MNLNAHRKLGEARFFYHKLKAEAAKDMPNREEFGFYLSAFLSAADSVIDVARYEVRQPKTVFKAWQESLGSENRELLTHMIEQRRRSVHQKGAKTVVTRRLAVETFYPYVQPLSFRSLMRGRVEMSPEGDVVYVWIPSEEHHFEMGRAQTAPVIEVCERYLRLLKDFLEWVEKRRSK